MPTDAEQGATRKSSEAQSVLYWLRRTFAWTMASFSATLGADRGAQLPSFCKIQPLLILACCFSVLQSAHGFSSVRLHFNNNVLQRPQRCRRRTGISSGVVALLGASSDSSETDDARHPNSSSLPDTIEANDADEDLGNDEAFVDEFGHPIEEKRIDYVGAGTLGDIMSSDEGFYFSAGQLEQPSGDYATTGADVDEATTGVMPTWPTAREDNNTLSHDEGLVTVAGGTLQVRFGEKIPNLTPLERIALTSNGNLQRIFSSYYDAPVHVHVDRCEMRSSDKREGGDDGDGSGSFYRRYGKRKNGESMLGASASASASGDGDAVWDREVHLSVHSQRFCTARSVVTVRSADCIRLVHSGKVGIGQLFRYLDRLPTFEILDAGRLDDGSMWRTYTLECKEVSCVIREDFVSNAWAIEP